MELCQPNVGEIANEHSVTAKHLAPVVRKLINTIHWVNLYPADSVVCFVNTYPLDRDLSGGKRYLSFRGFNKV